MKANYFRAIAYMLLSVLLSVFIFGFESADTKSNEELAASYFKELESLLQQDNGALWGRSLYAPTLFVNNLTHEVYANQSGTDSLFKLDVATGIYKGTFPKDKNAANSVIELGGMRWVMALWPLPEDKNERNVLLVHETFHYHQPQLGFSAGMNVSNHLDQYDARLWLKMEWNALDAAICATDESSRRSAIADALSFRQKRREIYPAGVDSENAYEILEGLPEYTAYTLVYPNDNQRIKALHSIKERYWQSESFLYSFAYYSGCAYAYLLDATGANWRNSLKMEDDLGTLLQRHLNIQVKSVDEAKNGYGFDSIVTFEQRRKVVKDSIYTAYKRQFLEDSVLVIDLVNFGIGFSPATIQDLSPYGTVYPNIRITGDFGILELKYGGCLISNDWSTATIPWKGKDNGDWSITLNKNFIISPTLEQEPLKRKVIYK